MNEPRLAAFSCLASVEDEGAYANLAMPEILSRARLKGRDAAFATELAYGTIRMRGLYDEIIATAAGRPAKKIEIPVLRALRLGVHQALAMRVPQHAAVDETVTLVRGVVGERATRFANAVMRRVVELNREEWLERVAPGRTRRALSIRYSMPAWVVRELDQALWADGRRDDLEAVLASANESAPVTLVARPGLVTRDEVASMAPRSRPTSFSPLGLSLEGGNPGDIDAVADGRAGIQDEGSQIVAEALVAAELGHGGSGSGERWLDTCAGPGGKTALLGAFASLKGATVDAIEIHPHRVDLVRRAIRALPKGTVSANVADAVTWGNGELYDRILVDAPCTGLGALRRRPEARWRRQESDLVPLTSLQRQLLDSALGRLKPGGVLAYVTCSPVLEETSAVVATVLAAHAARGSGVYQVDARAAVASATGTAVEDWGRGPAVQLWTHIHGTDSMFLALITREFPTTASG